MEEFKKNTESTKQLKVDKILGYSVWPNYLLTLAFSAMLELALYF